jgi:hypothetical protein
MEAFSKRNLISPRLPAGIIMIKIWVAIRLPNPESRA